jgi:hypothetical protein
MDEQRFSYTISVNQKRVRPVIELYNFVRSLLDFYSLMEIFS